MFLGFSKESLTGTMLRLKRHLTIWWRNIPERSAWMTLRCPMWVVANDFRIDDDDDTINSPISTPLFFFLLSFAIWCAKTQLFIRNVLCVMRVGRWIDADAQDVYRTLRKEEKKAKVFFLFFYFEERQLNVSRGCIWTLWASDIFTTGDGREFFIASCKFKCIYTPTFLQHIE